MKTIILAGGFGSRFGSRTEFVPKPMVEVGDKPIIWHVMRLYAHYGYKDFVLSLGYKADLIKDYFLNFRYYNNDVTINLKDGKINTPELPPELDWNVTLVNTGVNSLKGARIKRLEKYLDDVNMLTYGDGVADVDIPKLLEFHQSHGKTITVTGIRPSGRFGVIMEQDGRVLSFAEKPAHTKDLINGGFMVFNKNLLNYLKTDENCDFESGPLELLAAEGEVMVYKHPGNWECMDNENDYNHLNKLWRENRAFWKVW